MTQDKYTAIVPQGLDDAKRIVFGRTAEDLLFYLFIPVFTIFGLSMVNVIPGLVMFILVFINIAVSSILFRKAGRNVSATEYLRSVGHRARLPRHAPADDATTRKAADRPLMPDGSGLSELIEDHTTDVDSLSVWADESVASEYTRVRNVYTDHDVIQRDDGSYITAVEISGTNLYLRSQSERKQLINEFTDVLRELEFAHQIYITTEDFDVDEHAERHAESGYHDDVTSNPILQELHAEYQQQTINDNRIQQTRQRAIYAVIPYTPSEIQGDAADAPDIGTVEGFNRRQEMIDTVLSRRRKYITLISNITGVSAAPVSYEQHLGELVGHWQSPMDAEEIELPSTPLVPPASDDNDDDGSGGLLA